MTNRDDEEGLAVARRLKADIRKQTAPVGIQREQILDAPAFTAATLRLGAGDLQGAADIAASLLHRYPGHPEALFTLAMAGYWHAEQTTEAARVAADCIRNVVAQRPGFAIGWYNLGFLCQRQGLEAEAIAHYETCLRLDPTFVGAHVNLGNARLSQGNIEEALACFNRATGYPTSDTLAIYNRAIAYLLTEQWAKGWADYEARWQTPLFRAKFRAPPLPVWDGTPQPDKRLLVFSEQGFGDTIMCYRYRDRLTELFPAGVTWYVQAKLATLLNAVPDTEPYPEADLCIPTMSLMQRLGMPEDDRPYLGQRETYDPPRNPPRIGYVWAGGESYENDARRSIPRELFQPLLDTPGIEWVDLQVGRGGTYQPKDWLETATLVGALDMVVAVDTGVAHLAGAMGIPTLLLLPSMPDYRWGLRGYRNAWYESVTLLRQPAAGQWEPVIAEARRWVLAMQHGVGEEDTE